MIPKNKKTNYTDLPEGLNSQLVSTFKLNKDKSASESEIKNNQTISSFSNEEIKTVTKSEEKKKKADRNGQINICVPPETKIEWKVLFAKNNVNITQGIIFAVEHLKNEIEKGEAILTVGGVIKKINK